MPGINNLYDARHRLVAETAGFINFLSQMKMKLNFAPIDLGLVIEGDNPILLGGIKQLLKLLH